MEMTEGLEDHCNVQVCVRLKPLSFQEVRDGAGRCALAHENTVILDTKDPKVFTFDAVADESATQEQIFATVGKHITESCMAGYNGSIFAYGQTGSGKTHTIQGATTLNGELVPNMKGLIPRVLDHMYYLIDQREKESRGSVRFECRCSFLEIYNEKIMDLLNPTTQDLSIREDIKRGVYVENLMEQPVSSAKEALEVLRIGATNRHVASTGCNDQSSRSHSVFTITIKSKMEKNGVIGTRYSRLNLIDLAGSERQKLTQAKAERLKEAGHINKSLTLLGNVIRALVEVAAGKNRHVPYRDSKLTFLLKDSLGGNSKTTIIATISPLAAAFGETLSTLKFAQRAKLIQNKAVVNQDVDGALNFGQYIQLQRELKRVRDQLAAERARNRNKSQAQEEDPAILDASLSTAILAHNGSLHKNGRLQHQTALEHVRRLEALLNQLKSLETIDITLRRHKENTAHLKEQCLAKDKFIYSARMIIKFREATIESLRKKADLPAAVSQESVALKQEIEHLRAMVENHPDLLKHARESHHRKKKLKEYKRLFRDNMKTYWEEIGKAQYLAKELATYLDRVKRHQEGISLEAVLSSPAPVPTSHVADKRQNGWSRDEHISIDAMNWSLVSKKTEDNQERDTHAPSANSHVQPAVKDARKSIAWFNHEYEEENSWDIDAAPLGDKASSANQERDQIIAETAVQELQDKLQEEQILRNQVERLLEEEKLKFQLELDRREEELVIARRQIAALVDEKNVLSSDLTTKNERLRSLNHNLMKTKETTRPLPSSIGEINGDDEEFGDREECNEETLDEPISLRRLTMGVGLLRRCGNNVDENETDKKTMKGVNKPKKASDDNNISEVRILDLERRLAEKEREIEDLQDKYDNMKEEYEILIEEKRFREQIDQLDPESDASKETGIEAGDLTRLRECIEQLKDEIEKKHKLLEERKAEYQLRETELRTALELSEHERKTLSIVHQQALSEIREETARQLLDYTSKTEELSHNLKCREKQLEEANHKIDQLISELQEQSTTVGDYDTQLKAIKVVVLDLEKQYQQAEKAVDEANRQTILKVEQAEIELNELRMELDKRERRDKDQMEENRRKLEDQRIFYEAEISRIKEEMTRQWTEWQNQGKEGEREAKSMILRLNEEKEDIIARARRERDELEQEYRYAINLLEGQLRDQTAAALTKEAELSEELAAVKQAFVLAKATNDTLERSAISERADFQQKILDLEVQFAGMKELKDKYENEIARLTAHQAELEQRIAEEKEHLVRIQECELIKRKELEDRYEQHRRDLESRIVAKEREIEEMERTATMKRQELENRIAAEITNLTESKNEEITELEEKHRKEIEELSAQERQMALDFAAMKEEIEKSITERITYIKEIENRRQAERQAQDEVAHMSSLVAQIEKKFEFLQQEKDQLDKRVNELVLQNAKLTGHQNHKQKIHHHVKIKQENNSLKVELSKVKKELDRARIELSRYRPEGSIDMVAVEDEEEKLKKKISQLEETNLLLDTQLNGLHNQLLSFCKTHLSHTIDLTKADVLNDDSFSYEVVLDQLSLRFKAMSQEISDLNFKKLILERENALHVKKSQHGLTHLLSEHLAADVPSTVCTSASSSMVPPTSVATHPLADITNLMPTPTPSLEESGKLSTSRVHKEPKGGDISNLGKENLGAPTTTGDRPVKTSRSGSSRRERKAEERDKPSSGRSKREDREATKDRQRTRAPLVRTLSSSHNRPAAS